MNYDDITLKVKDSLDPLSVVLREIMTCSSSSEFELQNRIVLFSSIIDSLIDQKIEKLKIEMETKFTELQNPVYYGNITSEVLVGDLDMKRSTVHSGGRR